MMRVAVWVWVAVAAVSAESETKLYKKVGDKVVLELPFPPTTGLDAILWKHGPDIAIDWDGNHMDRYRQFKERGSLNILNGALTITGLTLEDGGLYTPEVNRVSANPIRLIVISPVPTPTVGVTCDEETGCILTCNGSSADHEPVTYTWRLGDKELTNSTKEQHITKEGFSSEREFSCGLENPVSRAKSQPITNPFFTAEPTGNRRIITGLVVFSCLLVPVVLLVLFHRCKAGMWFFQKESMPWKADFWSNSEWRPTPARGEAESNGISARRSSGQPEEEMPMTRTGEEDHGEADPV